MNGKATWLSHGVELMKVLRKTELSDSATSYQIEFDDEDLRVEESSEERYQRYLNQLRKRKLGSRKEIDETQNPPALPRS